MAATVAMPMVHHELVYEPSVESDTVIVQDELYGVVRLDRRTDAILIDLVSSKAVQRLRNVLQHGISAVVDMQVFLCSTLKP